MTQCMYVCLHAFPARRPTYLHTPNTLSFVMNTVHAYVYTACVCRLLCVSTRCHTHHLSRCPAHHLPCCHTRRAHMFKRVALLYSHWYTFVTYPFSMSWPGVTIPEVWVPATCCFPVPHNCRESWLGPSPTIWKSRAPRPEMLVFPSHKTQLWYLTLFTP